MNRQYLMLRRWRDILVLSGVGAAIAFVGLALGVSWLHGFLRLSEWVIGAAFIGGLCLLLRHALGAAPERPVSDERGTASRAGSVGPFRKLAAYLGLRYFVAYPPIWVAGIVGAGLLTLALEQFSGLRQVLEVSSTLAEGLSLVGWGFIALPILVLVTDGARACFSGYPPTHPISRAPVNSAPLHASWARFRAWLLNDAPVVRPEDDEFEHAVIAHRMARRLQEVPMPAQVIVGGLGTGKTTLRCLVKHELGNTSKTHVLPVELWPYDTPEAAVEGVLRTLVQGVALEVPVLAARGLPEEYVATMNAAGGFASNLASLATTARSPFDVLETIDAVATAMDHRFVVWVEDLERFARASADGGSLEESERLAPLRALLFGLSARSSISVVTATTGLHARFDTEKIARYVEELPPLEFADAARLLRAFRDECMKRPFTDPAAPEARRAWVGFGSTADLAARAADGGKVRTLPDAAVSLCRTPRTLKQALRRTLSYWEAWTGEVDFDDLLVMQLLRVAEPATFAVVRDHWDGLVVRHTNGKERKEALDAFQTALKGLELGDERTKEVVLIVKDVFQSDTPRAKPQGLANGRYWTRFLAEPEIAQEDRDQGILQTLLRDDDDAVLDLLEGPQSRQVENFSRLLPGTRLLSILVPLVRRRASEDPSGSTTREAWPVGDPPGMIPLWRMLSDAGRPDAPSATDLRDALVTAFEAAITNLHLVHWLEHYFVGSGDGHGPLYRNGSESGSDLAQVARERIWELLVQNYRDAPQALLTALLGSSSWTLSRVIWGPRRAESKTRQGIPFAEWSKLASTILEACRANRQLMLPQLAGLITVDTGIELNEESLQTRFQFDGSQAKALFESEVEVLECFVEPVDVEPDARGMVAAVRAAALQWQGEQRAQREEGDS